MNKFWKTLYILIRWNTLFDQYLLKDFKNYVYSRLFNTKNLKVLRHVLILPAHPNDKQHVIIGHSCEFGSYVFLDYSGGLEIGNMVTISEGTKIYTHSHTIKNKAIHWNKQPLKVSGLKIGSGAWIASNCVVLESCKEIGDGAIIGAGSIVTKNIPAFSISVGNPSKIIGWRK